MGTSLVRSGVGRVAAAAALILMGVAVTFAPAGAAEGDVAESAVTIIQTPSGAGGPCVPAPLGLTYTTANDAETFKLRIVAASAPCTPIEVKAVVYAMPGNGELWPQTLSEVVPFTISEAGVTEVVFAKGCGPVQFDVLSGETPQVISPLGAWHGPLLFPFDTATSMQYFGDPSCNPTTTTTTTTSTIPQVNGSTTVPTVSSTVPPPEVESITTLPVQVAGATQQPAQLALTGSGTGWGALVGASLIAAGVAMLALSRRRSTTAEL